MTDEKPRDVPPWLRYPSGTTTADGHEQTRYLPSEELHQCGTLLALGLDGYPATLPEWLAWRDRLAETLGLVPLAHDWLRRITPGTEASCNSEWSLMSRDGVLYKRRWNEREWQPTDDQQLLHEYAQMTRSDFADVELGVLGQLLKSPACPRLQAWHAGLVAKAVAAELRAQAEALADPIPLPSTPWWCGEAAGRAAVATRLRARADELDPQEKSG